MGQMANKCHVKLSSWCFGKLRYEWMKRVVTSTNDDGSKLAMQRTADIYLMAVKQLTNLMVGSSEHLIKKSVNELSKYS
jgi:hypothetical protein